MGRVAVAICTCVLAVILSGASAPGSSGQPGMSTEPILWSTEYTGTYSFSDYNRGYGRSEGHLLTVSEDYSWSRDITERITPHADGTFTDEWWTGLSAHGDFHEFAAGVEPTDVSVDCKLSTAKPTVEKRLVRSGTYNGYTLAKSNPQVEFAWALPLGGSSVSPAPSGEDEIRVTGGPGCPTPEGFLAATPGRMGTEWQNVPITQDLRAAFSGVRSVPYKSLPYTHDFDIDEKLSGTAPAISTTSVTQLEIHSKVTFDRIGRPKDETASLNKIGNLLLADGLAAITGTGASNASVPAAAPDPETVILPGAPGLSSVDLQVTGTVSGQVHAPRLAAGAAGMAAPDYMLETGSTGGGDGETVALRVVPTAMGHALFSGAHGELHLTVTLTLEYYGKKFSGSRAAVIPAVTPATAISSVTVVGDTQDPTFVIRGSELGSEPARDPATTPSSRQNCPAIVGTPGYDYGTSLSLEDASKRLAAGRYVPQTGELDCLGLIVTKFTPTEVDLRLGGFYRQTYPKYEISPGDEIEIAIGNAAIVVHARYGKTVSS